MNPMLSCAKVTSNGEALELTVDQVKPMRLQGELRCEPGHLLALVGPSGAGKSSLLRVIAGLMQPEFGKVTFGSEIWSDSAQGHFRPPQQRRVGMVFQNYALMPHLNALDNVALAANGDRSKARKLLEKLGLSNEQMMRRAQQLSGGQQQRVALARALAREPQVLLLDEPFSAVDQLTRQVLYRELSELKQNIGLPMIMVTHDLDEARLLCDQMAVIDGGVILQKGTPESIYQSPRNQRVAELVGIQNQFRGIFKKRLLKDPSNEVSGDHTSALSGPVQATLPRRGLLLWGQHPENPSLEILDKGRIDEGQQVTWVISGDGLELLPASAIPSALTSTPKSRAVPGITHSSSGTASSRVYDWPATVIELRSLGEVRLCRVRIDLPEPQELTLTFTTMNFPGVQLALGLTLGLRLDSSKIHVMPARTRPVAAL